MSFGICVKLKKNKSRYKAQHLWVLLANFLIFSTKSRKTFEFIDFYDINFDKTIVLFYLFFFSLSLNSQSISFSISRCKISIFILCCILFFILCFLFPSNYHIISSTPISFIKKPVVCLFVCLYVLHVYRIVMCMNI